MEATVGASLAFVGDEIDDGDEDDDGDDPH